MLGKLARPVLRRAERSDALGLSDYTGHAVVATALVGEQER
jgi:hypothetical protein